MGFFCARRRRLRSSSFSLLAPPSALNQFAGRGAPTEALSPRWLDFFRLTAIIYFFVLCLLKCQFKGKLFGFNQQKFLINDILLLLRIFLKDVFVYLRRAHSRFTSLEFFLTAAARPLFPWNGKPDKKKKQSLLLQHESFPVIYLFFPDIFWRVGLFYVF